MKKIYFLVPYPPGHSPSQRFRFEQFLSDLERSGHSYRIDSFLTAQNWRQFYQKGNSLRKLMTLARGFWKRCKSLLLIRDYDFVFIHREATPVGPPLFEWLIATWLRKKIIYDFDDAIWLTDRPKEALLLRIAKWRGKVPRICTWAHKISCGNNYLCDYASTYNINAVCLPTVVDTESYHNPDLYPRKQHGPHQVTIGWTGTHSTLKYLEQVMGVLRQIETENNNVRFLLIADAPASLQLSSADFVEWKHESEMADLMRFDIGIMPLPDDAWTRGKCGFKAIQYMAMEIPAVVSPVGINAAIIDHGMNGFLAATPDDWYRYLTRLVRDDSLRKQIGKKARKKIIDQYSVTANASRFLSLLE